MGGGKGGGGGGGGISDNDLIRWFTLEDDRKDGDALTDPNYFRKKDSLHRGAGELALALAPAQHLLLSSRPALRCVCLQVYRLCLFRYSQPIHDHLNNTSNGGTPTIHNHNHNQTRDSPIVSTNLMVSSPHPHSHPHLHPRPLRHTHQYASRCGGTTRPLRHGTARSPSPVISPTSWWSPSPRPPICPTRHSERAEAASAPSPTRWPLCRWESQCGLR